MGTPHRYRTGACRRARAVHCVRYPRAQSPVTRRRVQPFGGSESNTDAEICSAQNRSTPPHTGLLLFFLSIIFKLYILTRYLFCFYIFVGIQQFSYGKFNYKKIVWFLHPLLLAQTQHTAGISPFAYRGVEDGALWITIIVVSSRLREKSSKGNLVTYLSGILTIFSKLHITEKQLPYTPLYGLLRSGTTE